MKKISFEVVLSTVNDEPKSCNALFKNHNIISREFGNINVIEAVASIKLTFFALAKRDPFRIHCTESGKYE